MGGGWQLIGGHLALDLVNTMAWRRNAERRQERIPDPTHLLDWLAAATEHPTVPSAIAESQPNDAGSATLVGRVHRLREAAAEILTAHVDHQPLPAAALLHVDRSWQQALRAAAVRPTLPVRHHIPVRELSDVVDLLALAVGDLCQRSDLDRLRRCDDDDCGWFFLDTSRNHSRRWCDPDDCGNRARVRRFAERRRAERRPTAVGG